ncbi:MAG: hypothetical protein QOG94_2521 [Solirubrobacteraceae bacterium]|nr:hypothetical protein [Solirubrobacteraceae bacterium]
MIARRVVACAGCAALAAGAQATAAAAPPTHAQATAAVAPAVGAQATAAMAPSGAQTTAAVAPPTHAQATAAVAPPTRYALGAGELRLSDSRLPAGSRARLSFTVRLHRAVRSGRLTLTLPRRWTQRASPGGLAFARLPARGRASSSRTRVTRDGRVVRFTFTAARARDSGSFAMRDNGIPAGSYRLAFSWREGATVRRRGTARVVFAARRR